MTRKQASQGAKPTQPAPVPPKIPAASSPQHPHEDQQASATPGDQHPAIELRPGWHPVVHEGLPAPTYWPAVLAFGITLIAWGILTTWIIAAVGLIVFAVAIAGWIGDLLHGH